MGKILNTEYGLVHGTYWMYYGVILSFASAFLLQAGYTNSEIGLILALGNILACILQPVLADLIDRYEKFSLTRVTKLMAELLILLTLTLFVFNKASIKLWVIYILIVGIMTALQPLFNSLSFKLEGSGHKIHFSICRGIGSLAYGILCAFLGTLVEKSGVGILPIWGEVFLVSLLLCLIFIKRHFDKARKQNLSVDDSVSTLENFNKNGNELPQSPDEKIDLVTFIKRNKLFVIMNLGVVFLFFQNSIFNNFMLQIVEDVGGNSEDMGRIFSAMAFLEIPSFFMFDKVRAKFSCQAILKVGGAAFALKVLTIYIAKSVEAIFIAQLFQICSFGLFLPAMVMFINEIMEKGEAVKGQAWFTLMMTVSSIFASVLGGIMIDYLGAKFMLLVSTILAIIGSIVVFALIDKLGGH